MRCLAATTDLAHLEHPSRAFMSPAPRTDIAPGVVWTNQSVSGSGCGHLSELGWAVSSCGNVEIVDVIARRWGVKPILSAPAADELVRVPEMRGLWATLSFSSAAGLYGWADLVENSRYFRQLVDKI
jgi:hypothetical protein